MGLGAKITFEKVDKLIVLRVGLLAIIRLFLRIFHPDDRIFAKDFLSIMYINIMLAEKNSVGVAKVSEVWSFGNN